MTIDNKIFTTDIFNSEFRFRQFFQSNEEIAEIEQLSKVESPSPSKLFYNRWQVAWIICTTPVRMIISTFWRIAALYHESRGHYASMQHCQVKAGHLERPFRNCIKQWEFKETLLCPSSNFHKLGTHDLYMQPSLPMRLIEDPWVLDQTYVRIKDDIDFFDAGGLCAGASRWFVHLYLATKGMFNSPHDHVRAVGLQFAEGVPKKAALLHALSPKAPVQLFPINTEFGLVHIPWTEIENKQAIETLSNLPPACYELGTPTHRFVYIKIDDTLGFIFDPNKGVIVQQGNLGQKVFDYTLRYLGKGVPRNVDALVIDLVNTRNAQDEALPIEVAL